MNRPDPPCRRTSNRVLACRRPREDNHAGMRKILLIVLIGAAGLGIVTLGVAMLRGGDVEVGLSPPPPPELPLEITIDVPKVPERIKGPSPPQ